MIVLSLLACLVVGVGYAWLLYRNTGHLDKRLRYALFSVRTLAVALVLSLLFFPLVRSISYQLQKPVIVIGQDNSLSIEHIQPANFNLQQYEKDIRQLAEQLSDQYEVKIYHFGDSIKDGFNFNYTGKLTNASQLITRLQDELRGRNIGAVILATDGLFNRGGNPLYQLDKLRSPVYTVALGDTVPKKDLLIANVNYNNLVYLDNEFTLEVQIQALASQGERSNLTVLHNGKKIFEQSFQISSNTFTKSIPVTLKATGLGTQQYTVQVSPLSMEASEKNNNRQISIEVIDSRQKVLIAAAAPHPDISALRQAISLNKHFEVSVATAEDLDAVDPADYGLVILYQLPSQQGGSAVFLRKLSLSKASLWYVLGAQSNLSAFNQMQNQVSINGGADALQEAFSYTNPGFSAFILNEEASQTIARFDPLQAPLGKVTVAANASVVLNQRIGKVETGSPQLFFINDGERKAAYLMGEGVWRWRLSEAQNGGDSPVFNTLMSKVAQYLSVKDDKRKFRVFPSKGTFDENENVLLNAVLYNDSYAPVNTPDVKIQIRNERGKSYNYLFSRTASGYALNAGPLPPGKYTYSASTVLGDKKHSAEGGFFIDVLVAEYQQTTANHQLLQNMAVQTNGKMFMPGQLTAILNEIKTNENIKTLSYEDRKYEELINFKWLFGVILLLIAAEWFFRKRNGEI